jgi:GT2 family glycosyltransferase
MIMALQISDRGPRVSVGMPIYNAERYREEALKSLLGQSFHDFELVISQIGTAPHDALPLECCH